MYLRISGNSAFLFHFMKKARNVLGFAQTILINAFSCCFCFCLYCKTVIDWLNKLYIRTYVHLVAELRLWKVLIFVCIQYQIFCIEWLCIGISYLHDMSYKLDTLDQDLLLIFQVQKGIFLNNRFILLEVPESLLG